MRMSNAVLVACAAIALLLASWTSATEAKSVGIGLDVGVTFPWTTQTVTATTRASSTHTSRRGETSLVSRWLDSSLGSEQVNGKEEDKEEKKHHDDPHKPLLPLSARDYLGLAAASFSVLLAAGGGIGGGGLLVPIFLLIFAFGTREAVALSNVTILGGAIVSLLFFNLYRRNPRRRDRPLIDWDIILVMEPST